MLLLLDFVIWQCGKPSLLSAIVSTKVMRLVNPLYLVITCCQTSTKWVHRMLNAKKHSEQLGFVLTELLRIVVKPLWNFGPIIFFLNH